MTLSHLINKHKKEYRKCNDIACILFLLGMLIINLIDGY